MNPNTTNQHGVALAFVLIMLGFGGLVLVPLLNLS